MVRIRIVDEFGVDILSPFRYYRDIRVLGHANYGEEFNAEVMWYDLTSRYYKIDFEGQEAYIFSLGVRESG